MNADNFTQYLEDPSLLYQASYQELKSLALQYPYCQNLHLLLFQKSYMEGSTEWEQHLAKAAAYSTDRRRLYHLVQKLDKKTEAADNFLLSEEFLELKSLESLELEENPLPETSREGEAGLQLEFTSTPQEPSPGHKAEPVKLPAVDMEPDEEEEDSEEPFTISAGLAPKEHDSPGREKPETELAEPASDAPSAVQAEASEPPPAAFRVEDELIDDCSCLLRIVALPESAASPSGSYKKEEKSMPPHRKGSRPPLPSPELAALKQKNRSRPVFTAGPSTEEAAGAPKPQPKQSFTSWVEQFQSPKVQVRLSELMESKKREEAKRKGKKKKKGKKGKANSAGVGRLALRSITENKEILSETLAELLASQGEYRRAIEMYEALMLVFPKKSDFFAEKIKNLKQR